MGGLRLRGLIRRVEPLVEILSVAEVKAFGHLEEGTADDAVITGLITTMTRLAEAYTKRAFVTQEWTVTFDGPLLNIFTVPALPSSIDIPRPTLQTIDAFKYFDEDDAEQSFSLANIKTDVLKEPGRIFLANDASWPTGVRQIDSVHIEFTAGYGDTAADVPQDIKDAVNVAVNTILEHREELCEDAAGAQRLPTVSKAMLSHRRIFKFA